MKLSDHCSLDYGWIILLLIKKIVNNIKINVPMCYWIKKKQDFNSYHLCM